MTAALILAGWFLAAGEENTPALRYLRPEGGRWVLESEVRRKKTQEGLVFTSRTEHRGKVAGIAGVLALVLLNPIRAGEPGPIADQMRQQWKRAGRQARRRYSPRHPHRVGQGVFSNSSWTFFSLSCL